MPLPPSSPALPRWLTVVLLTATQASAAPDAGAVIEAINQLRQGRGLAQLQPAAALEAIAASHSAAMVASGSLSHDGFRSRLDRSGSRLCVENVAAGYQQAAPLLEGWLAAPAHRANLLEPRLRRIGVAGSGLFMTMFACE